MSRKLVLAAAALFVSAPMAMADAHAASGDAEAGERVFRQCAACHHVVNEAGEALAGRANTRTGPNLYAIAGRTMGSVEGFNYSDGLMALNATEAVWTEAEFAAYIVNPTNYIREATGDDSLRGAMANQRMRGDTAAIDLYAYIASLVPAE